MVWKKSTFINLSVWEEINLKWTFLCIIFAFQPQMENHMGSKALHHLCFHSRIPFQWCILGRKSQIVEWSTMAFFQWQGQICKSTFPKIWSKYQNNWFCQKTFSLCLNVFKGTGKAFFLIWYWINDFYETISNFL